MNWLESLRDNKPRTRLYVVASGAGAGIQERLWSVPGASSFLVGAAFPYAQTDTDAFLGYRPERYCSETTAIELAMTAFVRACEGATSDDRPVGLAVTATVASLSEHRGEHRAHVAIVDSAGAILQSRSLPKDLGIKARQADGVLTDLMGLGLLQDVIVDRVGWADSKREPEARLRQIFFRRPVFRTSGIRQPAEAIDPTDAIFLAGTFNPLHDGHRGMARAVSRLVPGSRCMYAVTASPVHKAQLSTVELLRLVAHLRADRWTGNERDFVFSDGDPLYIDKARRYPGAAFAIGADAVLRMLDPRWGLEIAPMLAEFRRLGTRFYVFGREVDGRHVSPWDINCHGYGDLFISMRDSWAVSSTELRAAAGA